MTCNVGNIKRWIMREDLNDVCIFKGTQKFLKFNSGSHSTYLLTVWHVGTRGVLLHLLIVFGTGVVLCSVVHSNLNLCSIAIKSFWLTTQCVYFHCSGGRSSSLSTVLQTFFSRSLEKKMTQIPHASRSYEATGATNKTQKTWCILPIGQTWN